MNVWGVKQLTTVEKHFESTDIRQAAHVPTFHDVHLKLILQLIGIWSMILSATLYCRTWIWGWTSAKVLMIGEEDYRLWFQERPVVFSMCGPWRFNLILKMALFHNDKELFKTFLDPNGNKEHHQNGRSSSLSHSQPINFIKIRSELFELFFPTNR